MNSSESASNSNQRKLSIGFAIEQVYGHVTYTQQLQRTAKMSSDLECHWMLIPWETQGLSRNMPVYKSNWTVRASLRARRKIKHRLKQGDLDALFFHTQTTAILCQSYIKTIPSIISLDATPMQYDSLGEFYNHSPGSSWQEKIKKSMVQKTLLSAQKILAWSSWTKGSLVNDYGVDPSKIEVYAGGIDLDLWKRPDVRSLHDRPIKILFVGGDFARKGGPELIKAFQKLQSCSETPPIELHLVTPDQRVNSAPGIFVYHQLKSNSPDLKQLYYDADIFCLPTHGDCVPFAIAEASAVGLPTISTQVGGISDLVLNGKTGLLVSPGDIDDLKKSLKTMIANPMLRLQQGEAAYRLACDSFDARKNSQRTLDLLRNLASKQSF